METLKLEHLLSAAMVGCVLMFCRLSPASKSTKAWTVIYMIILGLYLNIPEKFVAAFVSAKDNAIREPAKAALIALAVGVPLKYIQRKLRFARINAIRWKYGYTDDPASWENMTVEQAQEIESNMAEVGTHQEVEELTIGRLLISRSAY